MKEFENQEYGEKMSDPTLILTQNQEKISFRIEQHNSQSEEIMKNKPKLCVLLRIFRNKIL